METNIPLELVKSLETSLSLSVNEKLRVIEYLNHQTESQNEMLLLVLAEEATEMQKVKNKNAKGKEWVEGLKAKAKKEWQEVIQLCPERNKIHLNIDLNPNF